MNKTTSPMNRPRTPPASQEYKDNFERIFGNGMQKKRAEKATAKT